MFTESIKSATLEGAWRCDAGSDTIACCLEDSIYMDEFGCFGSDDAVMFRESEEDWQPKSIDIPVRLKVKCIEESGRKICFEPEDIKFRKWKNLSVNALKNNRAVTL